MRSSSYYDYLGSTSSASSSTDGGVFSIIVMVIVVMLYIIAAVMAISISVRIAREKNYAGDIPQMLWAIGLLAPFGWIASCILAGALPDKSQQSTTKLASTSKPAAEEAFPEI